MSWVILLNKAWMEDRQSDSFSSEKTKENLVTNFKAAFVGNKLGLNSWVICNGDNGGGAILGKSCHNYTSNKPQSFTPTNSGYNKLQLAWEAEDTISRPSDRWWNH